MGPRGGTLKTLGMRSAIFFGGFRVIFKSRAQKLGWIAAVRGVHNIKSTNKNKTKNEKVPVQFLNGSDLFLESKKHRYFFMLNQY